MQARFKKGSKEAKAFMAKLRAKKGTVKKVGAAKKSTGIRAKKQYNKEVDLYKYFVVNNGKVEAGYEYKSDAQDSANDFYPKAKVLTLSQLKQGGISDPRSKWKYQLSGTLKLSPNETRLGMTKHKDTRSHNVNIKVVSGVNRMGSIDLNTVGNELAILERDVNELKSFIKAEKLASERKRLSDILKIKQGQFKALKAYLNTIAKFTYKQR